MSEVVLDGLLGLLPSLALAWWLLRPTKKRSKNESNPPDS
jgi:hypothetical protein